MNVRLGNICQMFVGSECKQAGSSSCCCVSSNRVSHVRAPKTPEISDALAYLLWSALCLSACYRKNESVGLGKGEVGKTQRPLRCCKLCYAIYGLIKGGEFH